MKLDGLEKITDPEVLRNALRHISSEYEKLQAFVKRIESESEKNKQLSLLKEDQLVILRKLLFGKSSEKRKSDGSVGDRLRVEDQKEREALLVHAQSLVPLPKETPRNKNGLPEVIEDHEMNESQLKEAAKEYGLAHLSAHDFEEMKGFYDESVEITVCERVYKKLRHRRKKYRIKKHSDSEDSKQIILTAPCPAKLIEGAHYSIDFATQVIADKYVYHIPLERQVRQMEALGLWGVSPKTLYNLCFMGSVRLEPIAEQIREEILSAQLSVNADETPWPIQTKKQTDGYMWVLSNQAGSDYRFEPTRSGKGIEELLKGFKGPVLCDGYPGYHPLKKVSALT